MYICIYVYMYNMYNMYIYIYIYTCTYMICMGLSNEHSGPALNQQLGWLALDREGSFAWNGNCGILSTLPIGSLVVPFGDCLIGF